MICLSAYPHSQTCLVVSTMRQHFSKVYKTTYLIIKCVSIKQLVKNFEMMILLFLTIGLQTFC